MSLNICRKCQGCNACEVLHDAATTLEVRNLKLLILCKCQCRANSDSDWLRSSFYQKSKTTWLQKMHKRRQFVRRWLISPCSTLCSFIVHSGLLLWLLPSRCNEIHAFHFSFLPFLCCSFLISFCHLCVQYGAHPFLIDGPLLAFCVWSNISSPPPPQGNKF